MKKIILGVVIAAFAITSCSTGSAPAPKTQIDSLSYALGIDYGNYLKAIQGQIGEDINVDQAAQAIKDVLADKAAMTPEEAYNQLSNYFSVVLPQKFKEQEAAFLAEVQEKNKNIVKTESGLMYEIVKEGTGVKPTEDDTVEVFYTGTLKDGTVFDSNKESGETISFPLNGVIQGWTEGLQYIGEGGTIKLWIPAEMGYGASGTPDGSIGPYQPLIFEVELVKVNPEE